MRRSILLVVLITVSPVAVVSADEGGLFSEIAMESVFEQSTANAAVSQPSANERIGRITGVKSLIQALQTAGLEPQRKEGRATLELDRAGRVYTASISVQVDQDRIDCELSLTDVGELTTDKLLSLLASDDTHGAAFAYDRQEKRILLRKSLPNRLITAAELKADLDDLTDVADRHATRWSGLQAPDQQDAKQAESPQQSFSLVGRWSASRGNDEAFALQFAADSTFQLVHLKSGKSTVSKGKSTRSGNRLKLVGANLTINCTVAQSSSDAFQLAINDAAGKASATLNFKQAK